jgi:hypothetical protein
MKFDKQTSLKVKDKLESIIAAGKQNVAKAINDIQTEFEKRKDVIAKPSALTYGISDDHKNIFVRMQGKGEEVMLEPTHYASGQLLNKLKIPVGYAETLMQLKMDSLLTDSMAQLSDKLLQKGVLFRHVDQQLKGVLSPSYRRMDAGPIFEAFIEQALSMNMVPYNGWNTDYRYSIQFLVPRVYTPAPGEHVVYGASISTSDYGAQALSLELMSLRVICSNMAIGADVFRHVHIGRRFELPENEETIELSGKTYTLDTKTIASATKDAMKMLPAAFETLNTKVQKAASDDLPTEGAMAMLKNKNLSKDLLQKVKTLYDLEADVTQLPAHKSTWKLSNVISLLAKDPKIGSADARLDMSGIAMELLQ